MLEIKNLCVAVEGKQILNGFNLTVRSGEIHAIMGPNGTGKSTLAKAILGHEAYEITSGEVWFKGQNVLEMEPDERAHAGMFVGFQYPVEVPGVTNRQFLRIAYNSARKARGEAELSDEEMDVLLQEKMEQMEIRDEFLRRNLNEGFSGGEKKRNEILQLLVLNPFLAILDETDSGLDIDAMKVVASGVNHWMQGDRGLLLITHYHRLLRYIEPHYVHVMLGGRIVASGGASLALELEEKGYDWLEERVREGAL